MDGQPTSGETPSEVEEEDKQILRCRACETEIADADDIFSLDGRPAVQHFANPIGALWEVLTVRRARGLLFDGQAFTAFTWFPGYTWRNIACVGCAQHMGWVYEGGNAPPVFFGLVRGNLA